LANVYSTRFILDALSAGGATSVNCPAGFVWVVKDVTALCASSAGIVQVEVDGIPVWGYNFNPPAGKADIAHYSGMLVVNPTEALTVACAGAAVEVCVSGYQLSAP
jgi:hypothetical protein